MTLYCALFAGATVAYDDVIEVGGGRILLFVEDKAFKLPMDRIAAWVERSAEVVANYYGGFPVAEAHVAIRGEPGRSGGITGKAHGMGGAVVNVMIGLDSTEEDLENDWILVHEMIHLSFPSVRSAHHWIEEGVAVYVESIARMNVGHLTPEHVWGEFARRMHHGLPKSGDRGIDRTPTWGRTYWGGALYMLLADVEILRRTAGRKSLRDALRAIVAAGYDITRESPLPPVLEIADAATGETVLTELYEQWRATPVDVDLPQLWDRLGVVLDADEVRFVNDTPLANARDIITRGMVN